MRLEHFGWYLPLTLLVSFFAGAGISAAGYPGVRLPFYGVALVSLFFGLAALLRQAREAWVREGCNPSAANLAFTWQKVALFMIFAGIMGLLADQNDPDIVDLPRTILIGLLTAGCSAIATVNFVLFVLGKRRQASRPVDPGPLRPLIRRGGRRK